MKSQFFGPTILWALFAMVAGCISVIPSAVALRPAPAPAPAPARNAVLLVGLEDGSMIRQEIPVDADICIKALGDSATTCLTRAEPIMSDDGSRIIGYHMNRTEIDLYPGEK